MRVFKNKTTPVFSATETDELVKTIRESERKTSGEIRVFVERRCRYVDALDRAKQIFSCLEMEKTKLRNGVLFYLAIEDRQLAIFADTGIHQIVGNDYWHQVVEKLLRSIRSDHLITGLKSAIVETGNILGAHFPYQKGIDKNELPDEIVFGK